MNKIPFRGVLWIASDIHLGPDVPKTAQAFYGFLAQASQNADALILCGDIFDTWIGDDHALRTPPPWLDHALQELSAVARAIPLWLVRGNRDFLMGNALAQRLGARFLESPTLVQTDAGDILLAHGDEYCTQDLAYQRFRRLVHTPWVQQVFLSLPLAWRRAVARWARARSKQSHRGKPLYVMDVTPSAVSDALRRARCKLMIHGHTHQPAVHEQTVGAEMTWRYVLPDWEYDHAAPVRGGWISVEEGRVLMHAWVPAYGSTSASS
ncbi:MAG TPA: UDP-2,3-diacylglucosamine diphosphatase [Castellaniella sp.]|uniref:UDP-2,3-diacylglucosamine diphosphatase n=1 Tax=Castellaniella sp. TaxID=1955812 RepID=UPI002EFD15E6